MREIFTARTLVFSLTELLFMLVFSRSFVARVFDLELLLGCPDVPAELPHFTGMSEAQ